MHQLHKYAPRIDYRTLEGKFRRAKIVPMDADGIVEVGGCFILFEAKQEGEDASSAQIRVLSEFSKKPQCWSVLTTLSGDTTDEGNYLYDPVKIELFKGGHRWESPQENFDIFLKTFGK